MADVLTIATAGLRQDQLVDLNHIYYPRVDYLELRHLIDTEILNYNLYDHISVGKPLHYLETQIHSDVYLALSALRLRGSHQLFFAMSERVGIPLAVLNRYLPHKKPLIAMFQCWSSRQERAVKALNLFSMIDQIIVHCHSMKNHFINLGAKPEQVHVIHYSRDQQFFSPKIDIKQRKNFILSVGETRSRNYAALFDAVEPLSSIELLIAASGGWDAREKNSDLQRRIPHNTTVTQRMSLLELRNRYAQAQFVVVPVYSTVFSAGATVVLEAMCMSRAVVAFRSQGLTDYIIDGETGLLIDPGNSQAMKDAIEYLLSNPDEAERLGQNGRQRVEEELNLDQYVSQIAHLIHDTMEANSSVGKQLAYRKTKNSYPTNNSLSEKFFHSEANDVSRKTSS